MTIICKDLDFDFHQFSGGERHVQIHTKPNNLKNFLSVRADIHSSNDLIDLLLFADAVSYLYGRQRVIDLYVPYLPYSRQDRVCAPGQSYALNVLVGLVSNVEFKSIKTLDVHNPKCSAFEWSGEIENISQHEYFNTKKIIPKNKKIAIIQPDDGAQDRAAGRFRGMNEYDCTIVAFKKTRDPKNGHIVFSDMEKEEVEDVDGRACYIFDDICDGGMTFILIAKMLKMAGAKSVHLIVSHGIFSNGLDVFDGLIDEIYCSDSFQKESKGILTVINKQGRKL